MTQAITAGSDELIVPGHSKGLFDVFRQRFLLSLIVKKELRVRYHGSVLGMAWSYIKPAVQFIVYFLAMGVFLRLNKTLPAYPIYLFSGMVVITYFSEVMGNATRTLIWNAALIKKIFLPREMFPVASVYVAIVHFVPQLVVCSWAPSSMTGGPRSWEPRPFWPDSSSSPSRHWVWASSSAASTSSSGTRRTWSI